nr:class I SAM-dependent methyltransferase [Congregibacter litoralis]
MHPTPSTDELAKFYYRYHKTHQYTAKLNSKIRRARRRIRRMAGSRIGGSFLDVGCNAGFAVAAAHTLGFSATGIDIDAAAIAEAQKNFPDANFECAGVEEFARGETYDFIYCSEVIEHLPSLEGFLTEVRSLMHKDSLLLLTTPDLGHPSLRWPMRRTPIIEWDSIRPPEHLFYFNKQNLKKILNQHGFSRIKCALNTKPTIRALVQL